MSSKRKLDLPDHHPKKKAKIDRQTELIDNFDYDYIPIALPGDASDLQIRNIAITGQPNKIAILMTKFLAHPKCQDASFYLQNIETHKLFARPQNPDTSPKYDIVLYLFTDNLITKNKDLNTFSEMQAIKTLFENKQFNDKAVLGISFTKEAEEAGYDEKENLQSHLEKYANKHYKLQVLGFSVGYGSIDGLENSRLFVTFSVIRH